MAITTEKFDNGEKDLASIQEGAVGISAKDDTSKIDEYTDRFGNTRPTLPKILEDGEAKFDASIAQKEQEFYLQVQYKPSIPWAANTPVSDKTQLYAGAGDKRYRPKPDKVPFTTGSTIDDDIANGLWIPYGEATQEYANEVSNSGDSQGVGGLILPVENRSAADGEDLTGAAFVKLSGGDFTSVTRFPIVKKDGSSTPVSGNISSINLTTKPYSATIGTDDVWLLDVKYFDYRFIDIRAFWVVSDGTDQAVAIQAAFDSPFPIFVVSEEYHTSGVRLSPDKAVIGTGKLIGINPSSPNDVLVRADRTSNFEFSVNIDCGQTESTTAADNKYRYGFFASNAIDGKCMHDSTISGIKVGYPIFITGASANGTDTTNKGSKRLTFNRTRVEAFLSEEADGGNTSEIIIRSDFYTSDDGGVYFGGSNALRKSDYTVDPAKTFPATTDDITFTDCVLKNCDRVGVLNAKNVKFNDNHLNSFGYRGYNCSPTVEDVHIDGGSIDGAFGASINFSYGSKNCSAKNLTVNPVKYNSGFSGYGEGSTFRVNYGTTDCHFYHITGMGAKKRQAWMLGCKRIRFTDISLSQHSDGGSESSLVLSAGVNEHNVTYQVEDILVTDCDMEADIGIVLNGDFSTTASYADEAIRVKDCTFNAKTTLVSCLNTGQPDITNAMGVFNSEFVGPYRAFVGFEEKFLFADVGNSWGDSGTASFTLANASLSTLPYDLPLGHRFIVINGDPDVPSGASNQGVAEIVKLRKEASYIKFITEKYTEAGGAGVHAARFWMRHGSSSGNAWTPWYKYSYDNS